MSLLLLLFLLSMLLLLLVLLFFIVIIMIINTGGELIFALFEKHRLPLPIRSDLIGKPYSVSMLVFFVFPFICIPFICMF